MVLDQSIDTGTSEGWLMFEKRSEYFIDCA